MSYVAQNVERTLAIPAGGLLPRAPAAHAWSVTASACARVPEEQPVYASDAAIPVPRGTAR